MPQIAGKPYAAMIDALRSRLGGASPSWVIGDRGSTDGRFAVALGSRFAHVSSDVQEDPGDGATLSVANLLDAARMIVASE
jgi:ribonucleotide monophosphatase NagD (HAD superfamily)